MFPFAFVLSKELLKKIAVAVLIAAAEIVVFHAAKEQKKPK